MDKIESPVSLLQDKGIKLFGSRNARLIAQEVCKGLGFPISFFKEEIFSDGELNVHPIESVENNDIYVFHSLGGDDRFSVNDRLCELCFMLSSLKDQGAIKVTAVIPYLGYGRSDQRKEFFDSVNNRYVAQMIMASGVDKVISMDVHNISAFENAFQCQTLNLEASELFCEYALHNISKKRKITVLSPDIGGIKRAEKFRKALETRLGLPVAAGFVEKFRTPQGLKGDKLIGDVVEDSTVIIVDDMISTGGTIMKALKACRAEGASSIKVFATHGVFSLDPSEFLNSPLADEYIVTDSHPHLQDIPLARFPKLKVLSCASLFLDAIRHRGRVQ